MWRGSTWLFIILAGVTGVAHADGDASCRLYSTKPYYFSHPAAIAYVKTGVVDKGFEPKFSREFYAAILGLTDDLAQLLAARDKSKPLDGRILDDTVSSGKTQSLRLLLDYGVPPDYTTPEDATPILFAAQCKEPTMMSYLLTAGADVYWHNQTYGDAMLAAIGADSIENVRLLLVGGYDPTCATYLGHWRQLEVFANRVGDKDMALLLESAQDVRGHSVSKRACVLPPQDMTPLKEYHPLAGDNDPVKAPVAATKGRG